MQLPLFNTYLFSYNSAFLLLCLPCLYFPCLYFPLLPILTSTFSPHYLLLLANQDFMLIILVILVILTLILSLIILIILIILIMLITLTLILILILILHFISLLCFAFQKDSTSMLTTILLSELIELPTVTTKL